MFRLKRSKADAKFSDYIRLRDEGICQRCKSQNEVKSQGYHCSHFWGRGNKGTRFDPENAVGLCFKCHQVFGSNPWEHAEFFIKRLGQEKFDALGRRARTPTKVDESLIVMWCEAEIKKLKEKVLK